MQNVHHEVFSSHLANYEILLQSSVRWQIWGADRSFLHKNWFLNKCLVYGWQKMEKRDNKIFMLSPGRQYFTMQGQQLRRGTTSVKVRFCSTLWGKKKRVVHRQKARIRVQIRRVDLYLVYLTKHKFCVRPGFIPAGATGLNVTR